MDEKDRSNWGVTRLTLKSYGPSAVDKKKRYRTVPLSPQTPFIVLSLESHPLLSTITPDSLTYILFMLISLPRMSPPLCSSKSIELICQDITQGLPWLPWWCSG